MASEARFQRQASDSSVRHTESRSSAGRQPRDSAEHEEDNEANVDPASRSLSSTANGDEENDLHRSQESKQTLASGRPFSYLQSWSLEIASVALSIVSFLASMIVMGWSDNKPLSTWSAPISINAVVSVLTTISRMTLAFAMSACLGQQKWNSIIGRSESLATFQTFDEASRGPWGGIRLMLRLKLRCVRF